MTTITCPAWCRTDHTAWPLSSAEDPNPFHNSEHVRVPLVPEAVNGDEYVTVSLQSMEPYDDADCGPWVRIIDDQGVPFTLSPTHALRLAVRITDAVALTLDEASR